MNWFKNLNAMPKVMLCFGLILAFTGAIGTLGVYALSEQTAHNDQLTRDISGLAAIKDAKLANLQQSRAAQTQRVTYWRNLILLLMGAAALLVAALGSLISRSFSLPLIEAARLLEKVSAGDLTQRLTVTSHDEIGKMGGSLNHAIDSIDRALSEVGAAARNLNSSSQQLARAAEALASGAHEQAASLEQTSASLEQITATVRQNSDNAKHASQLAVSSRDSAEKGGTSAVETAAAMAEIKASSAKIAEIISTIDEIAFQTNLLSVNASVEAARAGSHGNGFKVVATEVRSLAQRSAAAAKEIKSLINGSVRKVENGSTLVTNSGATLKEIVTSVKRVSDIVGEIAAFNVAQDEASCVVFGMPREAIALGGTHEVQPLHRIAAAIAKRLQ